MISTVARRSLILALSLTLLSPLATAGEPLLQVQKAVVEILDAVKDAELTTAQRRDRIRSTIRQNFDFQSMSQSILATNWKKASPEEQEEFVEYFLQYLEGTYMKSIESYSDEKVLYHDERISGNRAVVQTAIVRGDVETPVDYRLRNDGTRWSVYDVVIEGSSLVNTYRNTFSAIVKSEGMQGLLQDLQRRISKYKQESGEQP